VCEVHGARTVVLGNFSGFAKKTEDVIPNVFCCRSLIASWPLRGKFNYRTRLLSYVAIVHANTSSGGANSYRLKPQLSVQD
jgi:hypothetical protein